MRDGDDFILFQDSSGMWCAAPPGFRNVVRDPTGWGDTGEEAIAKLIRDAEFQERATRQGWPQPTIEDFLIVPEPEGAIFRSACSDARDANLRAALRRQSFRVISTRQEQP